MVTKEIKWSAMIALGAHSLLYMANSSWYIQLFVIIVRVECIYKKRYCYLIANEVQKTKGLNGRKVNERTLLAKLASSAV